MLTVYRKNYWGKKDQLISTFKDMTELYNYFVDIWGGSYLHEKFSHNPFEFYVKQMEFVKENGKYITIPPKYCYVIENENYIRYSREFLKGEFRKIYKKSIRKIMSRWRSYIPGTKYHSRSRMKLNTFQTCMMSENVLEEECEPKWRAKRKRSAMPNWYDDTYRSDVNNNNWKRFRKTQWK